MYIVKYNKIYCLQYSIKLYYVCMTQLPCLRCLHSESLILEHYALINQRDKIRLNF